MSHKKDAGLIWINARTDIFSCGCYHVLLLYKYVVLVQYVYTIIVVIIWSTNLLWINQQRCTIVERRDFECKLASSAKQNPKSFMHVSDQKLELKIMSWTVEI